MKKITKQIRDEHFFDIRNGCVTLAVLLVIHQVQQRKEPGVAKDLSAKNIMLRIQKFLNPEENPPRRLAGMSTCYPTLKALEGTPNKKNPDGNDIMVTKNRRDGSFELTPEGEALLFELVDEMKRLTAYATQVLEDSNA